MGDGSDDAQEPVPSDVAALRATGAEAREVLNYKLDVLDSLDDKATWTSRTAVIVLGVLISTAGPTALSPVSAVGPWVFALGTVGVSLLLCWVLVGVAAATDSEVNPGPGRSFRREVRERQYDESEWNATLLDGYDEWIATADDVTATNRTQLLAAQVSLVGAILALVLAVGLSLMPQ
jgi:hypothetical protein